MARKSSGPLSPRTRSTYITSLIVIALVLFFLNIFSLGAIYYNLRQEQALEETWMAAFVPDYTDDVNVDALHQELEGKPWALEVHKVTKDSAKRRFMEEYGEESSEFFEMVGRNPLQVSLSVRLKHQWVNKDSVAKIVSYIEGQEIVPAMSAEFPIDEIEQLKANTARMMRTALIVGIVVMLIAFFIINSTVRLSIYSRRLMIRSMQLIGATNGFIRSPFLKLGVLQGVIAALLADILLVATLFVIDKFGLLYDFGDPVELLMRLESVLLMTGIVIFGALLGWLSSRWAVNRFLGKSLDQLM